MAEGDSAALFLQRFAENLYAAQSPENYVSPTTIYRIPSTLRDLDPNAYEPRVVSIGPYHYGKEKLQEMEWHKHRALNCFLGRNDGISFDGILAEFKREPRFSEEVRGFYGEPLEPQWSDDNVFLHLMVLDGCFLFELLLGNYLISDPTSTNDRPEKHAFLSYVKMDMLVLDNQIPLLILRKLASISEKWPTGSENVAIQFENLNITALIWKFYDDDEIPADLDDAHHVLDAYWRKCCIGTGDYDGWASSRSARELYYHRVEFQASSGGRDADGFVKIGRFADVAFKVHSFNIFKLTWPEPYQPPQNHQSGQGLSLRLYHMFLTGITLWFRSFIILLRIILFSSFMLTFGWFWYITLGFNKGMLDLPSLNIDETTRPTLLNHMVFERHKKTRPITDYVLLMASLIRSEIDVEHLRHRSILLCSPGWTNKSVVKLFADLSRFVVYNGSYRTRRTNKEMDGFCKSLSNMFRPFWRRVISSESSDEKTWCLFIITFYGLVIGGISTYSTIVKNIL